MELRTFRGGSGWNGATWPANTGTAEDTHWNYQETTGLLLAKTNADHTVTQYAYFANKVLQQIGYATGASVNHSRNLFGDLTELEYSDHSTAFADYSRAGLPRQITDQSGVHHLLYDHANRLVSDACVSGLLAGLTVSNHFDGRFGRDRLRVASAVSGAEWNFEHTYAYDALGRLTNAVSGEAAAQYAYTPHADRLASTRFLADDTPVLTTTRAWEQGERLQSIANTVGGAAITAHAYLYDCLHRRTQATLEDGSRWHYRYNDRGEVIAGKRYWADWTPVAGQQFTYGFDAIGNRTTAAAGGDEAGGNLRPSVYTANDGNAYTARTVPGAVDVLGAATAPASVTVNGGAAAERGEYFHRAVPVANGSGPVWLGVTNTATLGGSSASATGYTLVAPTNQTFSYDAHGNLTNDSVWAYVWDADNRLIQAETLDTVPAAGRIKLEFTYDHQGRRVRKLVSNWVSGAWSLTSDQRFVYDGWNLVAMLTSNSQLLASFTWGPDLSGTVDGAGGIGGLVVVREYAGNGTNHFPCFDGNGNVTALVNANGIVTARYEHGPFGEPIRTSGPLARANPFRWSTKFWDEETGLVYYGKRYYSPSLGRWLSKDPIEEEGGLNLYGFVVNSPLNAIDPSGLIVEELLLWAGSELGEKASEAMSKGGFVARIRTAVGQLNNLQYFKAGIMESYAEDYEKIIDAMQELTALAAAGLRGTYSYETQRHHLTPAADNLGKLFGLSGLKPNEWCIDVPKGAHHALHENWGANGGFWNDAWHVLNDKAKDPKMKANLKNPYFVAGFGVGLALQLGLDLDTLGSYGKKKSKLP